MGNDLPKSEQIAAILPAGLIAGAVKDRMNDNSARSNITNLSVQVYTQLVQDLEGEFIQQASKKP